MTRALMVVWLTFAWVLLWGTPSVGNITAGFVLAVALVMIVPVGPDRRSGLHPIAVVKFGVYFLWQLVLSTVSVTRSVLRPRLHLEEGIVAVPLRSTSPVVVTFVANAITLTPGTLTVDIRESTPAPVLYVHCLVTGDPDAVRDDALRFEALAVAAFGSPEDRRAVRGAENATNTKREEQR